MFQGVIQPNSGLYSRWNRHSGAHARLSSGAPCRRGPVQVRAQIQRSQDVDQQDGSAGLLKKLGVTAAGLLGAGLLVCSSACATEALAECAATPQVVEQLGEPVAELLAPAQECLRNGLEWVVQESVSATNLTESNFASVGPGGLWLANSPFCDVWDAYCTVLNERPLFTKIMTGMLGTFLGDLLAQCLANLPRASSPGPASATRKEQGSKDASPLAGRGFQYDAARTLRLLAYSALVGTPVAHWWFGLLDAWVFPEAPTSLPGVLSKMALDQALMAPLMTAAFFGLMKVLEGRPREAGAEVAGKLGPTMRANWAVWPVAHLVNFALVPAQQRILYINLISIAWTAYMSHMASGEEQEGATPAGDRLRTHSAAPSPSPSNSPTLKRAFSSSRLTR